jgi:uncharacterized protein YjbI with pentapeptide repeats
MTSIELAPGDELEGIELISLVLDRADAGSVRLERAHLESVDLGCSKLRGVRIIDTASTDLSASGGDWGGAQLSRATFKGGRLTGLSLGEARIEEVGFKDCKLDYANFRHSTIDHVTFDGCLMREADFGGAAISASRFSNCDLGGADFSKAELASVDMAGSSLDIAGSVLALRGAIVDSSQLIELAPRIAQELGITVKDA